MSGSLLNQNGELPGPNTNFNRKSFRLTGDHRVFDNLKVGGNISYTSSTAVRGAEGLQLQRHHLGRVADAA